MFAIPLLRLLRRRRALAGCLLACTALLLGGGAAAASLTVLVADEEPAHAEFVRLLRESHEAGSRFELIRLPVDRPAAEPALTEEDRVAAGLRARSVRPALQAEAPLTIAVGPAAARLAIERPGQEPLVLAMLSRLDFESLRSSPSVRRPERQLGVLLREPSMADQLTLIDAVLPRKRRLGVVASTESESLVRELQLAGQGWQLRIEYAPDAKSLASALRLLVPGSDALIVLPDMIGNSQAATLAVLRAGAGAGLPVFGTSDGLVRSGGLAAAVSTPGQLALQARALGQKLIASGAGGGLTVEAATPATVRVNLTVAHGLGLRLPGERELSERVAAAK